MFVRESVRPYVLPSTKSFSDFNEIWHVGRGRRLMHEGMQYVPIQDQDQGHQPFKVRNPAIFKSYLLRYLQRKLAIDHGFLSKGIISKFDRAGFLEKKFPSFCVT